MRCFGHETLLAIVFVPEMVKNGVKEIGIKEIPQWVKDGKPSPTGRHTFTTWKHWDKNDKLLPSGLLGPVSIRLRSDNAALNP